MFTVNEQLTRELALVRARVENQNERIAHLESTVTMNSEFSRVIQAQNSEQMDEIIKLQSTRVPDELLSNSGTYLASYACENGIRMGNKLIKILELRQAKRNNPPPVNKS